MLVADSNTELKTSEVEAMVSIALLFLQPLLLTSPIVDLEVELIVAQGCVSPLPGVLLLVVHCPRLQHNPDRAHPDLWERCNVIKSFVFV